jgi:hypothetical protein
MRRVLGPPPRGVDLRAQASVVRYVGSPEHKTSPSFAGSPKLRADATKCDPSLGDAETLTAWLRDALIAGRVGSPWEGGFPRYVWHREGDVCYEGRLVNRDLGEYKGYPLARPEWPEGL